jgi:hypothetical protein
MSFSAPKWCKKRKISDDSDEAEISKREGNVNHPELCVARAKRAFSKEKA